MIKQFEEELKNINISDIVRYINQLAGYEMINKEFGYNSLPKQYEKKLYKYEVRYIEKPNDYGTWEIKWNKSWDKYDNMFIYLNQLRFSLFDFEFHSLEDIFTEEQVTKLKHDIKTYFKYMCPSYSKAIIDLFNNRHISKKEKENESVFDII